MDYAQRPEPLTALKIDFERKARPWSVVRRAADNAQLLTSPPPSLALRESRPQLLMPPLACGERRRHTQLPMTLLRSRIQSLSIDRTGFTLVFSSCSFRSLRQRLYWSTLAGSGFSSLFSHKRNPSTTPCYETPRFHSLRLLAEMSSFSIVLFV